MGDEKEKAKDSKRIVIGDIEEIKKRTEVEFNILRELLRKFVKAVQARVATLTGANSRDIERTFLKVAKMVLIKETDAILIEKPGQQKRRLFRAGDFDWLVKTSGLNTSSIPAPEGCLIAPRKDMTADELNEVVSHIRLLCSAIRVSLVFVEAGKHDEDIKNYMSKIPEQNREDYVLVLKTICDSLAKIYVIMNKNRERFFNAMSTLLSQTEIMALIEWARRKFPLSDIPNIPDSDLLNDGYPIVKAEQTLEAVREILFQTEMENSQSKTLDRIIPAKTLDRIIPEQESQSLESDEKSEDSVNSVLSSQVTNQPNQREREKEILAIVRNILNRIKELEIEYGFPRRGEFQLKLREIGLDDEKVEILKKSLADNQPPRDLILGSDKNNLLVIQNLLKAIVSKLENSLKMLKAANAKNRKRMKTYRNKNEKK